MKILALDIATHCGWAVSKDIYGVWDLSPKRDESKGMRLIRLRSKLKEITKSEDIDVIVFERPGGVHKGAMIVQSELQGVVKLYCEDNKIEYRAYSSKEIKTFAAGKGKGNCNKELMIEMAKKKYGYVGDNDNEADALHLLHLAQQDLG